MEMELFCHSSRWAINITSDSNRPAKLVELAEKFSTFTAHASISITDETEIKSYLGKEIADCIYIIAYS